MDIKNVSCGNLTTDKGRQGRGAGDVSRKAQGECVKKQEGKAGEERQTEEGGREGEGGLHGGRYGTREFLRLLRACVRTPGD